MVTVTLESPEYDETLQIGKFEWVQLTHDLLRGFADENSDNNSLTFRDYDIDEEEIAWFNYDENVWYLTNDYAYTHKLRKGPWTDIIIS